MPTRPLCIDLFCGLGGWTEGFLAEGYRVVGFDNHRHMYGEARYPGQLVIQDVLTIHGSQFRDAAVIVASPPCQKYSYLAMPWSRSVDIVRPCGDGWEILNSAAAKELRAEWEHEGPDNTLFNSCFRIQMEAIEATRRQCIACGGGGVQDFPFDDRDCVNCAGSGYFERYIPLVIENVLGAIPWVGRSKWNFGSFHLWGDVPALMPINLKSGSKVPGFRFDRSGKSFQTASVEATGVKVPSEDGGGRTDVGKKARFTSRDCGPEGTKIGGDWFSDPQSTCRKHGSKSPARKAASASIAKIPPILSQHIAQVYKPKETR